MNRSLLLLNRSVSRSLLTLMHTSGGKRGARLGRLICEEKGPRSKTFMCVCIYEMVIYIYDMCMYVCMYVCVCVCVCIHIYIHVYTYVCTHTHTHSLTHTHRQGT